MLKTIFPRKLHGTWVFTDPAKGLENEPFVAGIDKMLDRVAGDAEHLAVVFSDTSFPGYEYHLIHRGAENGGTWYYCHELKTSGWLCPALLKYFPLPPVELFVRATIPELCKTNSGIVSRIYTRLLNAFRSQI